MIRNLTRQTIIARSPRRADTLAWRMRGMIGRDFHPFDALVFPRCGSIHTCFMGFPIDVLFVDKEHAIRGLRVALRPWRMALQPGACTVIELPAHALADTQSQVGDHLLIEPVQ